MRILALILVLIWAPTALTANGLVEITVWSGIDFIPQEQYQFSVTDRRGVDVAGQFEDGKAKLPYGPYGLKVTVPGFAGYEREFEVREPETYVLALLKQGDIADFVPDAPPTRIVGQIRNSPVPFNRLWVRVLSAQEGGRERTFDESKVREDGSFHFVVSNWLYDYWVLVLALDVEPQLPNRKRARIVHAVWASAGNHRDTNLEIDLSDSYRK